MYSGKDARRGSADHLYVETRPATGGVPEKSLIHVKPQCQARQVSRRLGKSAKNKKALVDPLLEEDGWTPLVCERKIATIVNGFADPDFPRFSLIMTQAVNCGLR